MNCRLSSRAATKRHASSSRRRELVSIRLDVALAERGLARSRSHAAELISTGLVSVDGAPARKAATKVREDSVITVADNGGWVSRAAVKLVAGLEASGVNPADRVALDLGTSTGGFAQVLLERGAEAVLGIEVGHGQLAAELRNEPRLKLAEGVNARDLTPETLARVTGDARIPDLVVADLSFISLKLVLAAAIECAAPDADFLLLVKPQFEVGRKGIREGIVTDPALRVDAVTDVLWVAHDLGLGVCGVYASPIAGGSGNREAIVWLRRGESTQPGEVSAAVTAAVAG